jgi:hypothetical protein
MTQTSTSPAPFATITARLGVHQATTQHATQRAAEMAARKAIKAGAADSAAVWTATEMVNLFGRGR